MASSFAEEPDRRGTAALHARYPSRWPGRGESPCSPDDSPNAANNGRPSSGMRRAVVQALQRARSRRKAGRERRPRHTVEPREWLEEHPGAMGRSCQRGAGNGRDRSERITEASFETISTSRRPRTETNARWRGCKIVSRGCISGRTTYARAERGRGPATGLRKRGTRQDRNRVRLDRGGAGASWTSKSARSPSRSRSRYGRRGAGAPISI